MRLVPMISQMYRFVGDRGEQVHSHSETESLADEKFRWSWCNLQEFYDMLSTFGLLGRIQNPSHLVLFDHLYAEKKGDKRRRLYVAVQGATTSVRFLAVTKKVWRETLMGIDPRHIFVPAGWAQTTVIRIASGIDPVREERALTVIAHITGGSFAETLKPEHLTDPRISST